jgi:hypothetical protein
VDDIMPIPVVVWSDESITDTPRCHSFVVEGQMQFLSDCTHEMAGQIVPIPPVLREDGEQ